MDLGKPDARRGKDASKHTLDLPCLSSVLTQPVASTPRYKTLPVQSTALAAMSRHTTQRTTQGFGASPVTGYTTVGHMDGTPGVVSMLVGAEGCSHGNPDRCSLKIVQKTP